jgi:hypothetical protein
VPAFVGCVIGVVAGNLLSVPLLGQTAQVYGVGALAVPVWVDVAVPLAMLGLAGVAAVLLALRAGRMSTVQAIATGRAPRPKHGYAAHRVLGRGPWSRLPRSVTIGLAGPFARPTRTAITLAAILFGGVAVTFGAGLGTSLDRVYADLSHSASGPVQVYIPGAPGQNGGSVVKAGPGPGLGGEIFDPAGGNPEIIGSQSTLATLDPGLSPDQYDVALTPGTSAQAYADALGVKLGQPYQVAPTAATPRSSSSSSA